MIIDLLKEYTSEQIANLSVTPHDFIELLSHANATHGNRSESQNTTCSKNLVMVYKAVDREKLVEYINTVLKPQMQKNEQKHPLKLPHELDTEPNLI